MAHNIMVISVNTEREFMKDNKCGRMAPKSSPHGYKTSPMGLVYLSAPTVSPFRVSGTKESYKGMGNITAKAVHMMETGETTNPTGMGYRHGLTAAPFKATTTRA